MGDGCAGFRSAALLAVILVLAGCRAESREERVLAPVVRLTERVEPPVGAEARCGLPFDVRPALGCIAVQVLFDAAVTPDASGQIAAEIPVPEALRTESLVLIPRVLVENHFGERPRDPPTLAHHWVSAPGANISYRSREPGLAGLGPLRLTVSAAPMRMTFPEWTTDPLAIDPGAVLRVSLAIDPDHLKAGAAAISFRVVAHDVPAMRSTPQAAGGPASNPDVGARVLLEERIEPDVAGHGWVERRIPLGALAGRTVRLTFSNALDLAASPVAAPRIARTGPVAGNAASPGRPVFSAPLWGAPRILAPRPRGPHRNVILISLDTMRADLLGRHEAGRAVTPNLDAFAERGVTFLDSISAFTTTTASHMSLLTSTYPAQHEVTWPADRLPRWIPTLAETLAQSGYATAAFTENAMISAAGGFARGFDVFVEDKRADGRLAAGAIDETLERGLRWIRTNADSPFFVFLHSYQVHSPYDPPAEFDVFLEPAGADRPGTPATSADARGWHRVLAHYLGEMLYADARIGAFLRELEWRGLLDETLIVITADHGEEFNEHGGMGHGDSTYEELIRVPLVLHAPGQVPAGARIQEQVSGVDVAPTILALVDVAPPGTHVGRSLVPLLVRAEGSPGEPPVRFSEAIRKYPSGEKRRLYAARDGHFKWIFAAESATPLEIYDLHDDPGEKHRLVDRALGERGRAHWHELEQLRIAAGARTVRERAAAGVAPAPSSLDVATTRKLSALGYLAPPSSAPGVAQPPPRRVDALPR